jgi:hypothetical protein
MSTNPNSAITLPPVIPDYFAAANDGRIDDVAACFAQDARVQDENHDHVGRDAIRAWVADTTQKYQPKNEVLRVIETNGTYVATSRVSGNFPGSPAELDFTFTVRDEKIGTLSIR